METTPDAPIGSAGEDTGVETRDERRARIRSERIRDHLANERTLLSWVRLGLGVTTLGFVIAHFTLFVEQLDKEDVLHAATFGYSVPFGISLVMFGPLLTVLAAFRYFAAEREIDRALAQPRHGPLLIVLALVVAAGIALAVYLADVSRSINP